MCPSAQQLHLQSYPEEKAPAKQALRITSKKLPDGNKSESRPMFLISETLEHQNEERGRKKHKTHSSMMLCVTLDDIKTFSHASQSHKKRMHIYTQMRPCMAVINPDHTWFKWNNESIHWLKHPPLGCDRYSMAKDADQQADDQVQHEERPHSRPSRNGTTSVSLDGSEDGDVERDSQSSGSSARKQRHRNRRGAEEKRSRSVRSSSKEERIRQGEEPGQSSVQLKRRSSEGRESETHRRRAGEKPRMVHEGRHKQRDPHVSLSSAKSISRDRSSKRKASSSRQSARSKGHGPKGRHIKPPIGEGRLTPWATPEAPPPWPKGHCGKGKNEKLGNAAKTRIIDTLIAVLKKEGDKYNLAMEGLNALIQKC